MNGTAPEVLLVAFHYPPEISGGIPRALAFEQALIERGCRVRVLTPRPADRGACGAEVIQVPLPGWVAPAANSAVTAPVARRSPLRDIARRWVFVPDGFVLWTRRALTAATAASAERPFDLVVTSSPPESTHAIGRRLKRRLGCAWLADVRDGWTFEPHRPEASLPLRAALERRMERAVVRGADWVTAATRPLESDLHQRFPERQRSIHLLPTGYAQDRADRARWPTEPTTPRANARFHMVFTGRMGLSRATEAPTVFFAALRSVVRSDPDFAQRFRLTMVGQFSAEEVALWADNELAPLVEQIGPVPQDEALRLSSAATMLLLLTPHGQRSIATRKVFDYLAVARPVFALAQDNEAERILRTARAGLCVPSASVDEVADGLRHAFGLWRAGTLETEVPCDGREQFRSAELFARVFDDHVLPGLCGP